MSRQKEYIERYSNDRTYDEDIWNWLYIIMIVDTRHNNPASPYHCPGVVIKYNPPFLPHESVRKRMKGDRPNVYTITAEKSPDDETSKMTITSNPPTLSAYTVNMTLDNVAQDLYFSELRPTHPREKYMKWQKGRNEKVGNFYIYVQARSPDDIILFTNDRDKGEAAELLHHRMMCMYNEYV